MSLFHDIEDALITELRVPHRAEPPTLPLFNKVDTYAGEREAAFETLIQQTAPSAWLQFVGGRRQGQDLASARSGRLAIAEIEFDDLDLTWSILVCARSLRAAVETARGGPGVVGAYECLGVIIGAKDSPIETPGRIRGRKLLDDCGPFRLVGFELMGQTAAAAVYDVQFATRVAL